MAVGQRPAVFSERWPNAAVVSGWNEVYLGGGCGEAPQADVDREMAVPVIAVWPFGAGSRLSGSAVWGQGWRCRKGRGPCWCRGTFPIFCLHLSG